MFTASPSWDLQANQTHTRMLLGSRGRQREDSSHKVLGFLLQKITFSASLLLLHFHGFILQTTHKTFILQLVLLLLLPKNLRAVSILPSKRAKIAPDLTPFELNLLGHITRLIVFPFPILLWALSSVSCSAASLESLVDHLYLLLFLALTPSR